MIFKHVANRTYHRNINEEVTYQGFSDSKSGKREKERSEGLKGGEKLFLILGQEMIFLNPH